ncbi:MULTISPECIES: molybdopterin-dependent oxidoreductase [unclassified Adlercreutzia]|uniref:molybdopterin-dependent oxidoreductase n=1 Tax=unclassified Adlercreutzia TaxID=2636013 RepID=UPI0013ECC2A2|nr:MULTISPECIES: molybdopterin-dependent oxidoreductase [unclassified Adlercreutzia]
MTENKPWKEVLDDGTTVIRTNAWSPPGCHPVGCGIKAFVKDGKLLKIEGDPNHPITKGRLCPRCLALKEYVYHPDRITYPMKRAREDRGLDKWERITWDEAWSLIKTETERIKEKYGPEGIVVFEGTGRQPTKTIHPFSTGTLGTPNIAYTQSGWSCYGPRVTITGFVFGAGIPEIDYAGGTPLRYDDPDFVLPKYITIWGKAPLESLADGFWGYSIVEMAKRGTKLITIDPCIRWLGTKAEYNLQLRPGTDAALGLGLLHVIINEDLYDHDFVEKWCYGFDELVERVNEHSVEWAAEITGCDAEDIRAVARILATEHPNSFTWGLAMDQNPNGQQAAHAMMAIVALTGDFDVPGGTYVGVFNDRNNEVGGRLPAELMAKAVGVDEYPALPALLENAHPDIMLECLETDKPYPIRMAWYYSTNLIAPTNSAQPHRWHDALQQKMEFAVATDLFMTPTTMALADLFLPLATFLEQDGMVAPHYEMNPGSIFAINKAISVDECKSDVEIMLHMGHMLNPEGWEGIEKPTDFWANGLARDEDISYEQLKEQTYYLPGLVYRKHEKGLLRPDGQPGFNTPTGLVELYSTIFEHFGEDPLPYYMEPAFSPISRPDLAKKYPLTLTTGKRKITSFHSEHRQIPSLRSIDEDPIATIHPDTAAKYHLKDGDWIWIENDWGRAKERVEVSPIVLPYVVSASHGWWYPEEDGEEPNLYGNWKSNINNLIPHKVIGKLGFGAPYKSGVPCRIYLAETE